MGRGSGRPQSRAGRSRGGRWGRPPGSRVCGRRAGACPPEGGRPGDGAARGGPPAPPGRAADEVSEPCGRELLLLRRQEAGPQRRVPGGGGGPGAEPRGRGARAGGQRGDPGRLLQPPAAAPGPAPRPQPPPPVAAGAPAPPPASCARAAPRPHAEPPAASALRVVEPEPARSPVTAPSAPGAGSPDLWLPRRPAREAPRRPAARDRAASAERRETLR